MLTTTRLTLTLTAAALALATLLAAPPVRAEMYKYKDPATGKLVITDQPPAGTPVAKPVAPAGPRWQVYSSRDAMKDRTTCFIASPDDIAAQIGSEWVYVALKVVTVPEGYLVGLHASGTREHPPSFHRDVSGLGVRVGPHPFQPVSEKFRQHILLLDMSTSNTVVQQMQSGPQVKYRVRFWPYDKTHDGVIPLTGFAEALQELHKCDAQLASAR